MSIMEEKTVKSQVIHKGNITEYVLEEVRLPNGKIAPREIVRHDDAAAIIPFTDDGKVLFVKQYRKPIEQALFEIPAGLMDETDASPLETAKRELEEETGCRAKQWEMITSFYSSPGFTDEFLTIYEAKGLYQVEEPLQQDEDENLELKALSFEEAWAEYEQGTIRDAKTVFGLFHWKAKRDCGEAIDE